MEHSHMANKFIITTLACLLTTNVVAETENAAPSQTHQHSKAQSTTYLGIDFFAGETDVSQTLSGSISADGDDSFDYSGFRLKLGAQSRDHLRFQGYFAFEEIDEDAFFDNSIFTMGADVMLTGGNSGGLQPYVLGGVTLGWTTLDDNALVDYQDDIWRSIGLKLGVGALYSVGDKVELTAGLDWAYRSWQEIKYIGPSGQVTLETEDTATSLLIGLNYKI